MLIKFVVDYRGRETGENFFAKGQMADLPIDAAEFLIEDGRAVEVTADKAPAPKKEKGKKEATSVLPLEADEDQPEI